MTRNSRKERRLRIIGGDWRSRVLQFADLPEIRPTPDRVRETLFNWLQFDITGAHCLDLFAGSGILGFEALSRGAASVLAVEKNASACAAIRRNGELLAAAGLETLQRDVTEWLGQHSTRSFDIVFIDPPFAAGLQQRCCELLQQNGWLTPGALVYLEAGEALSSYQLPQGWSVAREKRAGEVHYGLCRTSADRHRT